VYNGGLSQPKPSKPPASLVVRPSQRLVRPFYTLSFLLGALVYGFNNNRANPMDWLMIFPLLLLLWTVVRHIRLRFTTLTVGGGKLRYETGMLSRSTRTMELARIQDVRVEQRLLQRMLGIGKITVETAGETGRLSMDSVDRPQAVADFILESRH
jgi:putative membrane protein